MCTAIWAPRSLRSNGRTCKIHVCDQTISHSPWEAQDRKPQRGNGWETAVPATRHGPCTLAKSSAPEAKTHHPPPRFAPPRIDRRHSQARGGRWSASCLRFTRPGGVQLAIVDAGTDRMSWRRRRDSNPRYAFGAYNGLANRRLQPLGHVSDGGRALSSMAFYVKKPCVREAQHPRWAPA